MDTRGGLQPGDVEVSTLKWLSTNRPPASIGKNIEFKGYPSDFIDCILKRNPQLAKGSSIRPLVNQIASSYAYEHERIISDVISTYTYELQGASPMPSRYMRGHRSEKPCRNALYWRELSIGDEKCAC